MNKEIIKLRNQISKNLGKIMDIQAGCPHPIEHLYVEYKSDTGNYDPSEDSYWKECHCKWCDKKWWEDQ